MKRPDEPPIPPQAEPLVERAAAFAFAAHTAIGQKRKYTGPKDLCGLRAAENNGR